MKLGESRQGWRWWSRGASNGAWIVVKCAHMAERDDRHAGVARETRRHAAMGVCRIHKVEVRSRGELPWEAGGELGKTTSTVAAECVTGMGCA